MKTLLLPFLFTLTSFFLYAQNEEYLVKISLNTDNQTLNEIEKLKLPLFMIEEDYLITLITQDKYKVLQAAGIKNQLITSNPLNTDYLIVSRKDRGKIDEKIINAPVFFSDGYKGIIAETGVDRRIFVSKGLSAVSLTSTGYFRNEKDIFRKVNNPVTDTLISNITGMINQDSVRYFIQSLQDFGTRFLFANNRDSVSEWIKGEFLRMGYTDVKLDSFQYQSTWQKNVVATLQGVNQPDKYIVTGGHHDSYSSGSPLIFAPGADDNASGTAAVLETARVLKAAGYEPEMTIKFITFAAEEYGLWGSKDYAAKAVSSGMDIKLMINHDMISHTLYPANQSSVDINFYTGSESYRELAKQMVSQYTIITPMNGTSNSSGSDSHSFWTRGYKAIYFEERNFSPYYHSPQDVITNYNMEYCAEVIKASCATLLTAIIIPDQVKNFVVLDEGTGNTAFTQWSPNTDPDLLEYKIYVGTSSGNYNTTFTTTDTTFIVTGLSDGTDYFIAIAAVDFMLNESILVERTVKPLSIPNPPLGFTAIPEWHQVLLNWNKNTEMDLAGYNIYRSVEQAGNYQKLNQAVFTDTIFTDNTAQNAVYYFYQVKAVDTDNNESSPSGIVKSRVISLDQGILVVDETEDGNGALMNPTDEEVDQFYRNILDEFRFQSLDINQEGAPQLADLGAFSTVIWSGEDGTNTTAAMASRDVLKRYMEHGGNFIYIGYKPSRAFFGSVVYPLEMQPGSFLYDMLKIKDLEFTIFGRFFGGEAVQPGYNYINIDSSKTLPLYFHHLSNIDSIGAAPAGEEIYIYDTKYDSGSAQAAMKGLPVGVEYIGTDYKVVTFSFPLYYMKESQAKQLINYILTDKFNELTSVQYPGAEVPSEFSLSQNYPNPFNPVTLIKYQLPYGGYVNLRIFDMLGREVAVLADGLKPSGIYVTRFEGMNLSSGVYFYKLEVTPENNKDKYIETRKMILMK